MIDDHIARPGPVYWDFRCMVCGKLTANHARWYVVLYKRWFRNGNANIRAV